MPQVNGHRVYHIVKTVRAQRRSCRFLVSRILWRTGLCRFLRIDRGDYVLKFHPSSLSAAYWIYGDERSDDDSFLRHYLQERDVYVDVGANIGALVLTASTIVGSRGCVLAFEPHPRTFRQLEENVKINRVENVRSFNVAMGDRRGTVGFSDRRTDDQNAVDAAGTIMVRLDRLDNLIPNSISRVDLLKIDTEGYEKFVLEGAPKLLSRTDCVYFESWERHFEGFGYSGKEVYELLRSQGFDVFKICPPREIMRVSSDYQSVRCENLLAIRSVNKFLARTSYAIRTGGGCASPP